MQFYLHMNQNDWINDIIITCIHTSILLSHSESVGYNSEVCCKRHYITPFSNRLHIITWNVGSATPPDDVTSLLGLNVGDGNTDMYIIGWVFCGAFSFLHIKAEVSTYVRLSHIDTSNSAPNEQSGSVQNHGDVSLLTAVQLSSLLLIRHYIIKAPTHLLLLHLCRLLTPVCCCVLFFLQGCRKWTQWLTKGWKMSSSQTSGARSAWRDSAPLVMCWSVMAFYYQHICTLS